MLMRKVRHEICGGNPEGLTSVDGRSRILLAHEQWERYDEEH